MYVQESHDDWDEYLPFVQLAYNSALQTSTGYSPYETLFGCDPKMTVDIMLQNDRVLPPDMTAKQVATFLERINHIRAETLKNLEHNQMKQKRNYDKTHEDKEY